MIKETAGFLIQRRDGLVIFRMSSKSKMFRFDRHPLCHRLNKWSRNLSVGIDGQTAFGFGFFKSEGVQMRRPMGARHLTGGRAYLP